MTKRIVAALAAIACVASAVSAQADIRHYLTRQWYANGNHFCAYDNGTVLNVGYQICPLSI